jgi:DNA polymerase-3 subunit delta
MAKMAETIAQFLQLSKAIAAGSFAPVYLLHGEETYFLDAIADQLESAVLQPAERSFNQTLVYGKEISMNDLVSTARRYPMMSRYQLIVVKDAQHLKDWDKLQAYVENPLESTVLVLVYRGAKFDMRLKIGKALSKHQVYHAEKLRDYQLRDWIPEYCRIKGKSIDSSAANMLIDLLGADLSVIHNELDKVFVHMTDDFVRAVHIEQHVDFNREFNIFELQSALASRNFNKCIQIAHQMGLRSEKGELLRSVPALHNYFTKVLKVQNSQAKSKQELASSLGVNPFFVDEYIMASRNFSPQDMERVFNAIKYLDLRLKGVHRGSASDGDLLAEAVVQILRPAS